MTQTLLQPLEQRFIHSGISWQQFKLIQQGFSDSPGIRLFYYKGEVEILAVSPEHEFFSRTICILLSIYCAESEIEFAPTGSFTQEKEGVVSAQADESYFIGRRITSNSPPDLCIEVVFTSGNIKKLQRYRVLGVPEVWFWEDGVLAMYRLGAEGYDKIDSSVVLPDLDINLLCRCLLMASSVEAMREFRKGISG
ncbi:Uma2 family endonuclease [Microcoleus sp. herbarium14]|uniref:Uma2 family endonuclease n=1 Tax=Microcoleus sp. herbarium14 TaxID=3055439 RepID=UPI002FD5C98E